MSNCEGLKGKTYPLQTGSLWPQKSRKVAPIPGKGLIPRFQLGFFPSRLSDTQCESGNTLFALLLLPQTPPQTHWRRPLPRGAATGPRRGAPSQRARRGTARTGTRHTSRAAATTAAVGRMVALPSPALRGQVARTPSLPGCPTPWKT